MRKKVLYSTLFSRTFIFWRSTRNLFWWIPFFLILKVLFAKKFSYLTFFLEDIYFGVLQENLTLAIYWKMISLAFYEKLYFWRFTKSSLSAVLFFFGVLRIPVKRQNFKILAFYDFGVLLAARKSVLTKMLP